MYRDIRYIVDLRHSLQAPCSVGKSNQSDACSTVLRIDPALEARDLRVASCQSLRAVRV